MGGWMELDARERKNKREGICLPVVLLEANGIRFDDVGFRHFAGLVIGNRNDCTVANVWVGEEMGF